MPLPTVPALYDIVHLILKKAWQTVHVGSCILWDPQCWCKAVVSAGFFMSAAIVSLHICVLHPCICWVGALLSLGCCTSWRLCFSLCLEEQKEGRGALGSWGWNLRCPYAFHLPFFSPGSLSQGLFLLPADCHNALEKGHPSRHSAHLLPPPVGAPWALSRWQACCFNPTSIPQVKGSMQENLKFVLGAIAQIRNSFLLNREGTPNLVI